MVIETTKWDVTDYLNTSEEIAAFLEAVLEDGDHHVIAQSLGAVARSKGMTEVAKKAGVTRDALYKALSEKGDPKLSTLLGVMKALGLKLAAVPAEDRKDAA